MALPVPGSAQLNYPLRGSSIPSINGVRPDFAKLEFSITGAGGASIPGPIIDIEAIEYEDSTDPRFFHLTGPYPIARFRGQYKASGSIEWGMQAHRIITAYIASAGGGFGDVSMDITVQYATNGNSPIVTDVLERVRLGGNSQRNSVGGKGLTTKTSLSITRISWNDSPSFGGPSTYLADANDGT